MCWVPRNIRTLPHQPHPAIQRAKSHAWHIEKGTGKSGAWRYRIPSRTLRASGWHLPAMGIFACGRTASPLLSCLLRGQARQAGGQQAGRRAEEVAGAAPGRPGAREAASATGGGASGHRDVVRPEQVIETRGGIALGHQQAGELGVIEVKGRLASKPARDPRCTGLPPESRRRASPTTASH